MSDLLFYIPITFVILLVLETCKRDSPKDIILRTLSNFGILSAGLIVGGMLVFLINKYR